MDKRTFYSQPHIAQAYNQLRFGGRSGARVNAREIALVEALLPLGGRVLDLGCGTGRLLRSLSARGYRAVGLDTSTAMLAEAAAGPPEAGQPLVRADALGLPFQDGAFDAVVALRLAFHFADLRPLVAEAARVLALGGSLVFDTYRWSPRSPWALGQRQWGGRVYARWDGVVEGVLNELGLAATIRRRCFLFSPYVYRRLPLPLVQALERLEGRVPSWALERTFWLVQRVGQPACSLLAA